MFISFVIAWCYSSFLISFAFIWRQEVDPCFHAAYAFWERWIAILAFPLSSFFLLYFYTVVLRWVLVSLLFSFQQNLLFILAGRIVGHFHIYVLMTLPMCIPHKLKIILYRVFSFYFFFVLTLRGPLVFFSDVDFTFFCPLYFWM